LAAGAGSQGDRIVVAVVAALLDGGVLGGEDMVKRMVWIAFYMAAMIEGCLYVYFVISAILGNPCHCK